MRSARSDSLVDARRPQTAARPASNARYLPSLAPETSALGLGFGDRFEGLPGRDEMEPVSQACEIALEARDLGVRQVLAPVERPRTVVREELARIALMDRGCEALRLVQVRRGGLAPDEVGLRNPRDVEQIWLDEFRLQRRPRPGATCIERNYGSESELVDEVGCELVRKRREQRVAYLATRAPEVAEHPAVAHWS